MLRNYLKIAFRNVWKNKVFSIINILGLSIGLSAAFVIGAMVFYNLTFDNFHQDGKRIIESLLRLKVRLECFITQVLPFHWHKSSKI